jgi:hypothetical protein
VSDACDGKELRAQEGTAATTDGTAYEVVVVVASATGAVVRPRARVAITVRAEDFVRVRMMTRLPWIRASR